MQKKLYNEKRDKGLTGKILIHLYKYNSRVIRKFVLKMFYHLIGKYFTFYSESIRKLFKKYHNLTIGKYSHGGCFIPGLIEPGTVIGRYCSFAVTATTHARNHPTNTKSSSALFFNPKLGHVKGNKLPYTNLVIGNDVWIGFNAIILPSCKSIGDGAVIGAGVVVNKDIPPYAIVVGNPSRIVRYRFSPEKIDELLREKWWEKEIDELDINEFVNPLEGDEPK